eukprot:3937498-Rhodomonas_salina.1
MGFVRLVSVKSAVVSPDDVPDLSEGSLVETSEWKFEKRTVEKLNRSLQYDVSALRDALHLVDNDDSKESKVRVIAHTGLSNSGHTDRSDSSFERVIWLEVLLLHMPRCLLVGADLAGQI